MKTVVLTGGVGGAKFVRGLSKIMNNNDLTAIVNIGDDFTHLGLAISPDIDTLLYTLSDQANTALGWGRAGETWSFMQALKNLDGPDWFKLGDGDLAAHVLRSHRLSSGQPLSAITAEMARTWGIGCAVLPASDDPLVTWLETDAGPLPFQHYFVKEQCAPKISAIRFEGAQTARAAPGVLAAIKNAQAIFIAPSNPWLSVDPILAVAEIRAALLFATAPVIIISPLVGGRAVKGPTSKIMAELGIALDNNSIADHYAPIASAMLHDVSDTAPAGLDSASTHTLMTDDAGKIRVAEAALAFTQQLISGNDRP